MANEALQRRAAEIAAARVTADGTTERLTRLQSITAALGNTVTQEEVAESVLREASVALECDAGAVIVAATEEATSFALLRESGALDVLMRSFEHRRRSDAGGPYIEAAAECRAVYLESFDEMFDRYPAFRTFDRSECFGAWCFLPLEISGRAVGALAFGFAEPRTFTLLDRQFADTVARYCAQALDRVGLRHAATAAVAAAENARMTAEDANRAKTQFLRSMSHELRTPLGAIAGFAEVLELGIRGPVNDAQLSDLGRIRRAAAYLLRLIDDLLTVARLEAARPLNVLPVAVNSVLTEVGGLCANQAKAKAVELTVTPCSTEILVAADAEGLQQILLNLVANAIKFTPKDGNVLVTCVNEDTIVRIRVKDTGIGVDPADVDRVFEPYVQVNRNLTSAPHRGIGMGLPISRELARAMNGDLTLESHEGDGSTFTLALAPASRPLLARSSEPAQAVSAA
ncbi:MAG TPA: GAF domain-containing sensor histidine kinase [Gemmatimonadaceae bacterium]|nr:GAF domain-containing sensor histidine kinase [Gemmatimonadaceae bacterium]